MFNICLLLSTTQHCFFLSSIPLVIINPSIFYFTICLFTIECNIGSLVSRFNIFSIHIRIRIRFICRETYNFFFHKIPVSINLFDWSLIHNSLKFRSYFEFLQSTDGSLSWLQHLLQRGGNDGLAIFGVDNCRTRTRKTHKKEQEIVGTCMSYFPLVLQ